MQIATDWVSYSDDAAYLAHPNAATAPVPAVIVIQEIWGVDDHIQDLTERYATAGYLAIAPDLYSAGGGRPPAVSFERMAQAKAFLNTIPPPQWGAVLGSEEGRAKALSALPGDEAAQVGETIRTRSMARSATRRGMSRPPRSLHYARVAPCL